MPVFADLLDLRTAVVELVRDSSIADVFPRLVAMAENGLSRQLRMRQQITNATVTFAGGLAPMPDDCVEIIGLFSANGCEYVEQSLHHKQGYTYSIQGDNLVGANLSGDFALDYYGEIPALTGMDKTNWLLRRYPDVYLYAVGFEAAKHLQQAEIGTATRAGLMDAIATARADDQSLRYSRARVRVAGVTP